MPIATIAERKIPFVPKIPLVLMTRLGDDPLPLLPPAA
jgi:hypothetical protein